MFKSKRRSIVIPQTDHSLFAGHIASQLGNDQFQVPPLPLESVMRGVSLHDWGYLPLDTNAIGEMTTEVWLPIADRGMSTRFNDPVVDIVAKLHIRRLLMAKPEADRQPYVERIDALIAERLPETGQPLETFQKIDRFTDFCDTIAFSVCFEEARTRTMDFYADYDSDTTVEVTCMFDGEGNVTVTPWPFAVPVITGLLMGYQLEGYPEALEPVIVPYRIMPA